MEFPSSVSFSALVFVGLLSFFLGIWFTLRFLIPPRKTSLLPVIEESPRFRHIWLIPLLLLLLVVIFHSLSK